MDNKPNPKKNVTVFLMGGAGNQLFQIARAYSLQAAGYKVTVADLGVLEGPIYYLLGFTRHDNWIDLSAILDGLNIPLKTLTFHQLLHLFWIFVKRKYGASKNSVFDSDLDVLQSSSRSIDVGYFQSLSKISIESMHAVALSLLASHPPAKPRSDHGAAVLHLRGGDFGKSLRLGHDFIERILMFCGHEGIRLNVVTNDVIFYHELFEGRDETGLVCNDNALSDFLFLVNARLIVASNSTFSFWAMICASAISAVDVIIPEGFFFQELRLLSDGVDNLNILDLGSRENNEYV